MNAMATEAVPAAAGMDETVPATVAVDSAVIPTDTDFGVPAVIDVDMREYPLYAVIVLDGRVNWSAQIVPWNVGFPIHTPVAPEKGDAVMSSPPGITG